MCSQSSPVKDLLSRTEKQVPGCEDLKSQCRFVLQVCSWTANQLIFDLVFVSHIRSKESSRFGCFIHLFSSGCENKNTVPSVHSISRHRFITGLYPYMFNTMCCLSLDSSDTGRVGPAWVLKAGCRPVEKVGTRPGFLLILYLNVPHQVKVENCRSIYHKARGRISSRAEKLLNGASLASSKSLFRGPVSHQALILPRLAVWVMDWRLLPPFVLFSCLSLKLLSLHNGGC